MTPREQCAEAVRRYLDIAGCETVDGLWNGLRRAYSQAEIRKALRDLGAEPRKIGDWPTHRPCWGMRDTERWPRHEAGLPNFVDPFTLYKLGAWEARMAPAPEAV